MTFLTMVELAKGLCDTKGSDGFLDIRNLRTQN